MNTIWTPEKVERLTSLWNSTMSAAQIAADLGSQFSRSAVLGKAHRLRLAPKAQSNNDPQVVEARKNRKRERDREARRIKYGAVPRQEHQHSKSIESLNLTFAEIGRFQCRWIGNDDMSAPLYCGNPTADGTSWCQHHLHVVTRGSLEITESDRQRRREHGLKIAARNIIKGGVLAAAEKINVLDEEAA